MTKTEEFIERHRYMGFGIGDPDLSLEQCDAIFIDELHELLKAQRELCADKATGFYVGENGQYLGPLEVSVNKKSILNTPEP